jgi:hypothetical protein
MTQPQRTQDGSWRVGDGMVCLATLSHCYIARFKPSGELLPLYSIPQPGGATHVPVAAWLPHHRRPGGAEMVAHGDVWVPYAVLALAWGPRLVLFNIPLVGDHSGGADAGARARWGDYIQLWRGAARSWRATAACDFSVAATL